MTGLPDLLRECAPQVLAVLVRRYGDFEACEDAVQEALIAAGRQWPESGVPAQPRSWLITVASRRRVEQLRNETARRNREEAFRREPPPQARGDDELALLLLCCHPALSVPAQVTLTLRAVGGLTTAEIARGLLLPEATVGQRISRAKQRIRDTGSRFEMPAPGDLVDRLTAVRHVLYLIFNEGHTASSGDTVNRVELTGEAIRLTRQLHRRLPDDGEVAGLLALMLLTDARRPARTGSDGTLIPSPSRTGAAGTARRSPKASPSSPVRWRRLRSARSSCRPRSPRCTARRGGPRTPIGRRSLPCTACCMLSPPAPP